MQKKLKAKTFKTPDLSRPRFRDTKFAKNLISNELYNEWIEEYPQFKETCPDYKSFLKIWNKITERYRHYTVTNSMGVKLPFYCGELSVEFINIDYEALDPIKSQEAGVPVMHLNWNTSEKLGKLVWCIRRAMKFNKSLPFTGFKGTKQFAQQAKHGLKNNPEIYKTAKTPGR